MLDGLHNAGLLTDDEYTSGLFVQKWADQSRESAPYAAGKMETKGSGFGVGWPPKQSLMWVRAWVGPFAWRVIEMALLEERSVAEIESELDLPVRSAKVALKTALSCASTCIHDDEAIGLKRA